MTLTLFVTGDAVLLLAAKSTILLALAALVHAAFGRHVSAGMRHMAWCTVLASVVLLPAAMAVLPTWPLAVARGPIGWPAAPAIELSGRPRAPSTPAPSFSPSGQKTRATPAPSATATTAVTWSNGTIAVALALVYFAGVLVLLARLGAERLMVLRLARSARSVTSTDWQRLLEDGRRSLRIERRVHLVRSALPVSPMTWGVRTPTILIPDAADAWGEERRYAVLLHELAHVARWDCLTQVAAVVVRALYWMHPGVWWAVQRLGIERELACDDRVITAGIPPRQYAAHLLEIARTTTRTAAGSLALSLHTPTLLEGRMRAILDTSRRRAGPRLRTVLAAGGVLASLLGVTAAVRPVTVTPGRATTVAPRSSGASSRYSAVDIVAVQSTNASRALTVVEELRIGGSAREYAFGEVDEMAVGRDGAIFVADNADNRPRVRMYDAAGRFVNIVGDTGTGPGAYRGIMGMRVLQTGELAIYDAFNKRISVYDARGAFVRSLPSRVAGIWTGNDFQVDADGNFYVYGVRTFRETGPPPVGSPVVLTPTTRPSNRFFLKLSPRGDVLDTVDIPESKVSPQRGFTIMTPEAYLTPFQNALVYDLSPSGHVVWGYTAEYAFTINAAAGRPRRIRRDFTPVLLLPEERAQWEARARFYDKGGPKSASSGVTIPAAKPAYRDIDVAEDGRLWVHRYAIATERPVTRPRPADAPPPLTWRDAPMFDVFEADGRYHGTLTVPNNTRLRVQRGDGLWGTNVLPTGETQIVRYRLK